MNAAVCKQLAGLGFEDDAADLAKASTPVEERRAIENALHAIEGYQLAVRRHYRALMHTGAGGDRDVLADVEEQLIDRLAVLSATHHLEKAS